SPPPRPHRHDRPRERHLGAAPLLGVGTRGIDRRRGSRSALDPDGGRLRARRRIGVTRTEPRLDGGGRFSVLNAWNCWGLRTPAVPFVGPFFGGVCARPDARTCPFLGT